MKKIVKTFLVLSVVLFFTSCAVFQTSMSPTEVYKTLPEYTKTFFLTAAQANNSICQCLVKGRSYTAPIGLTVKDDLWNGAKGIDEWVKLDGGNAYVLKNYQWITVGMNQYGTSATQLYVEFDTYFCKTE
jgi:hypothetical protein